MASSLNGGLRAAEKLLRRSSSPNLGKSHLKEFPSRWFPAIRPRAFETARAFDDRTATNFECGGADLPNDQGMIFEHDVFGGGNLPLEDAIDHCVRDFDVSLEPAVFANH